MSKYSTFPITQCYQQHSATNHVVAPLHQSRGEVGAEADVVLQLVVQIHPPEGGFLGHCVGLGCVLEQEEREGDTV